MKCTIHKTFLEIPKIESRLMKINTLYILFLGLLLMFNGCKRRTDKENGEIVKETIQKTEKTVSSDTLQESEKVSLRQDYKSKLRSNEKIELGKVYTDTVTYIDYNDDYDHRVFYVEKNKKKIGLVYTNDSVRNFVQGDQYEINWKVDKLINAGDPELLDFSEFLISFKKIKAFKLTDTKTKVLWRDNDYDEALKTEISTMVLNKVYFENITAPEKAAIAYIASFIGNECEWDGKVNNDRSNLKCMIPTALNLGYQCSDEYLFFLRKWFAKDTKSLKKLLVCITMPNTATIQTTFDEISIVTNANDQTILLIYNVKGFNTRDGNVWSYTQTDKFQYNPGTISLIDSKIIEHEPLLNSQDKKNNSFVVSCGSGCAMTYTENKAVHNENSFEVTFKVEMHVNEVIEDTYFQTYVFTCDTANKLEQITLQDNPDFNIENEFPIMQENLKRYVSKVCLRHRSG